MSVVSAYNSIFGSTTKPPTPSCASDGPAARTSSALVPLRPPPMTVATVKSGTVAVSAASTDRLVSRPMSSVSTKPSVAGLLVTLPEEFVTTTE